MVAKFFLLKQDGFSLNIMVRCGHDGVKNEVLPAGGAGW
jgi:hypothetical protein